MNCPTRPLLNIKVLQKKLECFNVKTWGLAYIKECVNLRQKSFMRSTPGENVLKLFTVVTYEFL
jgi:hypothetical protein